MTSVNLPTPGQRIEELQAENAALRAEIESLRKDSWNQLKICTWIGNQLMSQPAMFERHEVCRFVRSLGRSEVLAKHIAALKEK